MSTARVLQHYTQPQHTSDNTKYSTRFIEKQQSLQKHDQLKSLLLAAAVLSLLAFATFQLARGTMINVSRYLMLNNKMADLQQLNSTSEHQNAILKRNYKNYNSPQGVENLARDYLQLVGDNEISVVIKKS